MFNVPHAVLSANGSVQTSSFRMTHIKYESLKNEKQMNTFLRSKMKKKGDHTHWKKFGSWTLSHGEDTETHIYMWAFLKGTHAHTHTYRLNEKKKQMVFDDMLLLHFNTQDSKDIPLKKSLPLTTENIADWLECVVQNEVPIKIQKPQKKIINQQTIPNTKKTPKDNTSDVSSITTLHNKSDDDISVVDAVSDEDENTENLEEEDDNCSEKSDIDDEACADITLLLEDEENDDDDMDVSDTDNNNMSDDDNDDTEDECYAIYDDNVLVFEDYTYDTSSTYRPANTLLSLWTS